jgi:hypothetical protein
MKKTNKENPLTFFRKANESRQKVVKNSLTKARNGIVAGPQTEMQSIFSNAVNSQPPVPYANRPSREEMMMQKMMGQSARNIATDNSMRSSQGPQAMQARSAANLNDERRQVINNAYMNAMTNRASSPSSMRSSMPKTTKGVVAGQEMEFTPEQMKSIFGIQKRGGSVKRKK